MATRPETRPAPKSRPKIQRLPPLPPAETNYHRFRKRIHVLCVLIFIALPFFNVMRFDIPRQRFYFAGFELWINEFAIIFFSLMFLMFVIAASAIMHGRVYCSYACPQMIFSEWSNRVELWSAKQVKRRLSRLSARMQSLVSRGMFYAILGVASVFLAFVFTAYFVEPADLFRRLMSLDIATAGGLTGAVVTLITFLDFTLLRQRFCTTVCPYGYLQGMLQDKETLLVVYQDGKDDQKVCIECGKCVRVCHMGIDIRESPFQLECVHCGECIDACEDVLRRIGRPGLIHYTYGEQVKPDAAREPWYRRLGFRDAKRAAILLILLFYAIGLVTALSMRRPVLVRFSPDRSVLYKDLGDGRYANTIRLTLANRSSRTAEVKFWTEGLPGGEVALPSNPVSLEPGQGLETSFEVRVAPWEGSSDVNRFQLLAQASGEDSPEVAELTFILPVPARRSSR